MNRFSRLEALRRLKEESAGQAFARTLARIDELRQQMVDLDRETAEEKRAAMEALAGPQRPDPAWLESFLAGQAWRRGRLDGALRKARMESEVAREAWRMARMQLQQAEVLAQKEGVRILGEQRRAEMKEMDMLGIYRSNFNLENPIQSRRG
ncbi:MAG: flagellar export protein FliJ [Magnetococcales bacterium]|nr:flagellar export protein FliJ [Magnetococcales bacterium]